MIVAHVDCRVLATELPVLNQNVTLPLDSMADPESISLSS